MHEALRRLAGVSEHPYGKKFPVNVPEKEKLSTLWG
jgi:hypothetical protein